MEKTVNQILADCRQSTINTDVNGISDNEFIRYINNAQTEITKMIFTQMPDSNPFGKDKLYTIVPGQQAYDMPYDIFTESSIIGIAYTNNNFYQPLQRASNKERNVSWGYNILGRQFLLNPFPLYDQTGTLVLTYVRKLPSLDIRRCKVLSIAGNVVTMTAAVAPNLTSNNIDSYCCFCDVNGVIKAEDRLITNVSGADVTLNSATGIAAGEFLTLGKYSTANSQLDEVCESGIFEYVNNRIFLRDSSKDFSASKLISAETLEGIVAVYKQSVPDNISIPISNWGYMPW